MTTIYYILGILLLFIEVSYFINPTKKAVETKRFRELYESESARETKEYKRLLLEKGCGSFLVLGWFMTGLFTIQWPVFLIFLILVFGVFAQLGKVTIKLKADWPLAISHWISSLASIITIVFLILNHFHLHIDIVKWFLNLTI